MIFSAQRNFALEQTGADWVLYLDADERLNDELIAAVKDVMEHDFIDPSVFDGTKIRRLWNDLQSRRVKAGPCKTALSADDGHLGE